MIFTEISYTKILRYTSVNLVLIYFKVYLAIPFISFLSDFWQWMWLFLLRTSVANCCGRGEKSLILWYDDLTRGVTV